MILSEHRSPVRLLASTPGCLLLVLLLLPFFVSDVDAFANDDGKGRPQNGRLLYAWGRDNSNQLSQGDFNTDISTLIDRSKSACFPCDVQISSCIVVK
jgi:hypothetical protein